MIKTTLASKYKLKKFDIIYFEWLDAGAGGGEWNSVKEAEKYFQSDNTVVKQTGFYYGEDKTFVYTVGQILPEDKKEDWELGHLAKTPKILIKTLTLFNK